jgi:hypothetical protein
MNDESKAAIVTSCWILAFFIGVVKGGSPGLIIALLSTAIFVSLLYMDMLRERANAKRREERIRTNAIINYYKDRAEMERGGKHDNR